MDNHVEKSEVLNSEPVPDGSFEFIPSSALSATLEQFGAFFSPDARGNGLYKIKYTNPNGVRCRIALTIKEIHGLHDYRTRAYLKPGYYDRPFMRSKRGATSAQA
jgi:hypothetical protein